MLAGVRSLPGHSFAYLMAGGVAYTVGVPFFARDGNLDHAMWHLFVLAGSTFHYLSVQEIIRPHLL